MQGVFLFSHDIGVIQEKGNQLYNSMSSQLLPEREWKDRTDWKTSTSGFESRVFFQAYSDKKVQVDSFFYTYMKKMYSGFSKRY